MFPKHLMFTRLVFFPPSVEGPGSHSKLRIQNTNDGLTSGVMGEAGYHLDVKIC